MLKLHSSDASHATSAATSRAYALRYREELSQDMDLVGLSLANAVAGCSSTFVVNGSPTKTAIVDSAGGRTRRSAAPRCAGSRRVPARSDRRRI